MAFVLADVVVGVLSPEQVDVGGTIPVLGGQRHTGSAVCLQQGGVDEVVGIDDALGQSACHLAVVDGVDNLLRIVLTLLTPVTTNVVNHADEGELTMHLIINAVGNGTAGFTEDDVLLANASVAHHRAHE